MLTELRPTEPEVERSSDAATPEPRWLRVVAFASAAAVAAFGATGLFLAIVGAYRPIVVFPLGAAVWIALLTAARAVLRAPGATAPADHVVGGAAVLLVAGVGIWNAQHAAQHVLINRDGGVYANAGRWIAAHGNLRVVADVGPFARAHGLSFTSTGMYDDGHHVLSFQFAHLLPSLLAEMRQVGGDRLMFATPAVLASVALLALFLAAWRFLRNPFVALAAIASFAFLMPVVSFSRDTVSEIPSQVLLFTALWLIVDRRAVRTARTMFVAGLSSVCCKRRASTRCCCSPDCRCSSPSCGSWAGPSTAVRSHAPRARVRSPSCRDSCSASPTWVSGAASTSTDSAATCTS